MANEILYHDYLSEVGCVTITSSQWREKGVLLVYADYEMQDCPMDKFFFGLMDAYMMLSSIHFEDESCA